MKIQTRPRRPQYKNALKYTDKEEREEVWEFWSLKVLIITKAKLGQNWRGHTSKQTRQFSTSDFNERNFGVNPKIRPFAMNFLIGGILPKRFPFSFFFFGLKCKKQRDSCAPTRKCRVHTKQAAENLAS